MKNETFQPADVLLGALFAFWQQGFEGTHMPQLLDSMNVDHKMFDSAFGSKRDVFLKSLDLYFANIEDDLAGLISGAMDSGSAVAALVDGILAAARKPAFTTTEWRGCLMGNTALEFGAHDREIVSRLRAGVEILRAQFKNALSLPSADGARPSEDEIDRSALHLIAGIQGLLVLAKSGLSEVDIKIVRSAILASAVHPLNVLTPRRRAKTREGR